MGAQGGLAWYFYLIIFGAISLVIGLVVTFVMWHLKKGCFKDHEKEVFDEEKEVSFDGVSDRRRLVEQHHSFSPPFTSLTLELGVQLSSLAVVDPPELMPSSLLNEIEPDLWMVAASFTLW